MKIYNKDMTQELTEDEFDDSKGLLYEVKDADGESVLIFVSFTERELAERRIAELKALLQLSDYRAIKYAEGEISAEEYATSREQRKAWRAEINELEMVIQNEGGDK